MGLGTISLFATVYSNNKCVFYRCNQSATKILYNVSRAVITFLKKELVRLADIWYSFDFLNKTLIKRSVLAFYKIGRDNNGIKVVSQICFYCQKIQLQCLRKLFLRDRGNAVSRKVAS